MKPFAECEAQRYCRFVVLLIAGLMLLRLACAAVVPLAFDEAYYWTWSKNLSISYYDHPPMVALIIRLGTLIAGDNELGVRLISVLLGIPATWAVWRSAAILFADARLAATAALFFNLTLIVAAGTIVVTPDDPLLFATAFVLFFLAKVAETDEGGWWLAVGAAAGAALLSKYTALLLGASIASWLLIVPEKRRWLATPWPWLGGAVALALFAPVVIWNSDHRWASFIKQFGRVRVEHWTPHDVGLYVASQIGMATPSIFILGLMGLWAFGRGKGGTQTARILIGALVWPVLLYFLWHSLHAQVQGDWTAPIFPALVIAAAAAVHVCNWRDGWARLAEWSHRLAVPVGLAIIGIVYLQAAFGLVPFGSMDPTARDIGAGWAELAAQIDAIRVERGARAVLTTSYAATGWLSFYLPGRPPVIQFNERIRWVNEPAPDPALFRGPLLYVCRGTCKLAPAVRARYQSFEEVAQFSRQRRGVTIETYRLYRVSGPKGEPLDLSLPKELR